MTATLTKHATKHLIPISKERDSIFAKELKRRISSRFGKLMNEKE
jgi:hypothetical protein